MHNRTCQTLAVSAACLFLATAGCTDLTVAPQSTVTEANIFSTPASYQQFLAKLYAGLAVTGQVGPHGNGDIRANDEGFYNYVRNLWVLNELPTDEAILGWGDAGVQPLNRSDLDPQNPFIVAMYYRIYFQVAMTNEFLRQTTDTRLDARGHNDPTLRADVAQYRAEARFLRALSYWHGIDMFGPVPLIDENFPIGATPPAQSTRTAVYDFIVAELTDIIGDLPPAGAATYGRATDGAAQMLLAKVYMNAGVYTGTTRYTEAMTAIQAVIAGPYALQPIGSWRNTFLADNHTAPDIIFPVTSDGLRTQTWGGTTFLLHASCGGALDNATFRNANGIDFCWWGLRMKPEAYNRYAAGDTARTSWFGTSGQTVGIADPGNFNHGIAAPKFSNRTSTGAVGSHSTHPDTDYPMFRLADAYLMYAEANLRAGGGSAATALGYVNALRQRSYGDASGDITAPQLTLDFVLDERGRELLWEGHRRSDLIRYGRFSGSTYLWAWKGGTVGGAAIPATRDLYPFPASELVANPNLAQNPGY